MFHFGRGYEPTAVVGKRWPKWSLSRRAIVASHVVGVVVPTVARVVRRITCRFGCDRSLDSSGEGDEVRRLAERERDARVVVDARGHRDVALVARQRDEPHVGAGEEAPRRDHRGRRASPTSRPPRGSRRGCAPPGCGATPASRAPPIARDRDGARSAAPTPSPRRRPRRGAPRRRTATRPGRPRPGPPSARDRDAARPPARRRAPPRRPPRPRARRRTASPSPARCARAGSRGAAPAPGGAARSSGRPLRSRGSRRARSRRPCPTGRRGPTAARSSTRASTSHARSTRRTPAGVRVTRRLVRSKRRGPDLLLQRAHVPPEGLRGDVVPLRGLPEVQFLRQRHRVAERLDVHGNASVTGDATARRGAEERLTSSSVQVAPSST